MKKIALIFALLLALITSNTTALQADPTSDQLLSSTSVTSLVTASNYCDFLNYVATERDPKHLYNEAMASDPATASIVRIGAPGQWHYQVIAGRENFPIHYVSNLAQANYADRLQFSSSSPSSTSTFNFTSHIEDVSRLKEEISEAGSLQNSDDSDSLSCNKNLFEVEMSSTMLTLASSSPTSTSTSNVNSYIGDVSEALGFAAMLALCPELMTRRGGDVGRAPNENTALDDSSDRASDASDLSDTSLQSCASSQSAASARTTASMGKRNNYTLGLVDFTTAALEHPTANRLIIDEGDTEAIIPSKSSVLDMNKNVKENKTIALAFKDVLRNEYSRELAERLIPGQRDSVWDSFSLGSANIFQYINKVEKRITDQNIIATKESNLDVLSSHVERKKITVTETQEFYEKHQAFFDAQSEEKTLSEKSDAAVGTLVDSVGNAHLLGLPVGAVIKAAAVGARKAERTMRNRPLKLAKKIAEGAKEDHDVVEKRWINFQRKEAKKNGTPLPKRGVRFNDSESPSNTTSLTAAGGIDTGKDPGIDAPVRSRIKFENDHLALWEEAIRLETAAEAAGFRVFRADTPANTEAYIEASRLAKAAWTKAAEARESAASKSNNERDKNLLLADTTTAEEKADEWGRALNRARARHNEGSHLSVMDDFPEKVIADTTVDAPTRTLQERLAVMESALKEAEERAALLETKKNEAIAAKSKMGTRVVESKKAENALKSEIETLKAQLQSSEEADAVRHPSHSALEEAHTAPIADSERLTTKDESSRVPSPEQKIDSKADPAARKGEIERLSNTAHEAKNLFSQPTEDCEELRYAGARSITDVSPLSSCAPSAPCPSSASATLKTGSKNETKKTPSAESPSTESPSTESPSAEIAWADALKASEEAELAWTQAHATCAAAGSVWFEMADQVEAAYRRAIEPSHIAEAAWASAVQAKESVLEKAIAAFESSVQSSESNQDLQASLNKAKDFKDLKTLLSDEINKAKAEQAAWAAKVDQAEKIAQDVKDSKNMSTDQKNKIIAAKAAFAAAKTAWVDFSKFAQVFIAHPNTANYYTANAASYTAATAAYTASGAAFADYSAAMRAADAAFISSPAYRGNVDAACRSTAAAEAARTAAGEAAHTAAARAPMAASAASAAEAARAVSATTRTATDATAATRAAKAASEAAAAAAHSAAANASYSANTMWCEDQTWAIRAAQEAADFHEAVAKWRKKKEEGCIIQ